VVVASVFRLVPMLSIKVRAWGSVRRFMPCGDLQKLRSALSNSA
jgi:hypothetical protein